MMKSLESSGVVPAMSPDENARNARLLLAERSHSTTRSRLPTVDIVIPCYNYGRYLQGCVQSVLSQPDIEARVLIVDDASADNTCEIGKALANEHPAVEYRRHATNQKHIATYNEGLIGWSQSDYCVLLSADDMLAPGSLGRAVRIMEADGSIGLVYGRAVHFQREEELPLVQSQKFSYKTWSGRDWLERRCRAGHNVITSPEVVVRGNVQRAVGGYRPELPHAGDLEMWLRIAAISNIAYIQHVPQAFYRVHAASMMRTVYRGSFTDLRQRKLAFDSFFEHNRHLVLNAEGLFEMVNRTLAREALWDACRAYDRDRVLEAQADELVEFAVATYEGARSLGEYAGLLRRRRLGPTFCNRTQLFAAPALLRKVHRWSLKRRWKRGGV